jgi:hypothetical protein
VTFDIVTPGCSGQAKVLYVLSGFTGLIVLSGAGDDLVDLSAIAAPSFDTLILGGSGADVLIGAGGNDSIFGNSGDDCVDRRPGPGLSVGGNGR